MVDDRALSDIFSLTTGVWTIAGILALTAWRLWNGLPAVMAQWVAWRQAKMQNQLERERASAEAKAADWERLRGELGRIYQRLETSEHERAAERVAQREENEKCRRDLAAVRDELAIERSERMKLQAIIDGMGEVRQAAANASAEVRLDAADKAKRK